MPKDAKGFKVVINEFDDVVEAFAGGNEKSLINGAFHQVCTATIQVFPTSTSHNVIICSGRCRLRLPIPVGMTTLGQLAEHCRSFNKS